jgi:hypothetical protein
VHRPQVVVPGRVMVLQLSPKGVPTNQHRRGAPSESPSCLATSRTRDRSRRDATCKARMKPRSAGASGWLKPRRARRRPYAPDQSGTFCRIGRSARDQHSLRFCTLEAFLCVAGGEPARRLDPINGPVIAGRLLCSGHWLIELANGFMSASRFSSPHEIVSGHGPQQLNWIRPSQCRARSSITCSSSLSGRHRRGTRHVPHPAHGPALARR